MQAKVCGLTTAEQVETCVSHGANFCGFILNYQKSHRYINYQIAKKITDVKKHNAYYVGVLVNPSKEELTMFSNLNLDYFQIYGNYSKEQLNEIKTNYKKKIIMSLQIKDKQDVLKYKTLIDEANKIIAGYYEGCEITLAKNFYKEVYVFFP